MTFSNPLILCGINDCRLLAKHLGEHNRYPTSAWSFMQEKDKRKLDKAGFATPRGGAKGAYQNHVVRSNRVIIPYERLLIVPVGEYKDGYVIRLYPEQYFECAGIPKPIFLTGSNSWIIVGQNAFVLYRTHQGLKKFPPLSDWSVCHLEKNGVSSKKRGRGIRDMGHYVLRIPTSGGKSKREEGVPQGMFAPEYADQEINYLCKCVLAWLITQTVGSPYVTTQAKYLQAILAQENLLNVYNYERKGVIRHGLCSCPLCLRFIRYQELHASATYEDDISFGNAAEQVEGAIRSTIVNLFHIEPLIYERITHAPSNVAWGHHSCNTRLGQKQCRSLAELIELDLKVGIIKPEGIETFGWISENYEMIRSPLGSVWIRISDDQAEDTPPELGDLVVGNPPFAVDPVTGTGQTLTLVPLLEENEELNNE